MKKTSNIFVFLILLLALLFTSNSAFAIKEWTIMSYLDADNDLEEYLLADFVEMGAVGSTDQVNIVAQVDRVSGYTTAYGNWTNTRRFYIKKGDTPSSTPLEQLGELNMGDKNTLRDFIIWAVTNYPAKKYMLILSNHGGGWRKRNMQGKVTKAICWDETNNDDCLYMKDVQIAMKDAENATGKKITVIGFDACLMAMIEVATDMKDCADVMIASEEVEPGNGWPYTPVLTKLTTTPTMTGGQLASIIVDEYALSYKGIDSTITLSAVDLTKISALNTSIKTFVDNANQWTKIKDARLATRTYSEADGYPHADLGHFMSLLSSKGVTDPAVLSAAAAVRNNLTAAVFANKYGSSRTNSNGLAIFFPKTTTAYTNAQGSAYPTKDFNLATGWDSFLKKYFNPPADKPISDLSGAAAVDGSGVATLSRTTPVPV
ncbi:MAG TPA: clostripain-related cysteine peptidase, partial [bacterium]|nr:clostripain-related cysteine peptidase [bacterium]